MFWKPCCHSKNHTLEYGPATHRVTIHASVPVEHLQTIAGICWLGPNDMIIDLCPTCQEEVCKHPDLSILCAPKVW